jgi:hypothetical protein
LKEEMTMFKTISAALLAVSVLAAPAFAAGSDKTDKTDKTAKAPAVTAAQVKPGALNANAKMRHHGKHLRHHPSQKKVSAVKTHTASKLVIKHTAPVAKRG